MTKSKLPNSVLRRIWNLSDIDQDGMLDRDEFAVSMFLIDHKLGGNDIPDVLPDRLVPPSKVKRFDLGAERRGRASDDYSGGNSHEASYTKDSGYGRDASYRGSASGDPGHHRGGGGGGAGEGREQEDDASYGGRQSLSSRGRYNDDYDEGSGNNLASFIDRGH